MNKRSGFTLVEVLVSISIFLIIFMGIISGYYLALRRTFKLEEYQYIENICLDIDKVYDSEGYAGLINIYGFNSINNNKANGEIYYDSNYKLVSEDYKYILSYTYDKDSDAILRISIKNITSNYYVIKNLEYGHSKYDDASGVSV